jgi:hypothetical protein
MRAHRGVAEFIVIVNFSTRVSKMIKLLSMYPSKRKSSGSQSRLDVVEKRQTLMGADIRIAIAQPLAQSLTGHAMR